ncbi:hypothetical protein [Dulcicalothrix desertica]|nr:hypothetical protein [Dulcicalothrix desertica]
MNGRLNGGDFPKKILKILLWGGHPSKHPNIEMGKFQLLFLALPE